MTVVTLPLETSKQDTQPVFGTALEAFQTTGLTSKNPWLSALRKNALERFHTLGYPTRRLEAWKYLDLRPILKTAFTPYPQTQAQPITPAQVQTNFIAPVENSTPVRLVFVNGVYAAELSAPPVGLAEAVVIAPLSQVLNTEAEWLSPYLAPALSDETDAFAALNAALFSDGTCVRIPKSVELKQPIQLLFLTTGDSVSSRAAYTRSVIVVEEHARASVLIQHLSLNESSKETFNNPVVEIAAAPHSHLDVTFVQAENQSAFNLAATRARLQHDSTVQLNTFTVNGHTSRHQMTVWFLGEHANCHLNGLAVLNNQTQAFNNVRLEHIFPHCASSQLFKGILEDQVRSEFDGTIVVHRNAVGTDAQQLNKNLVLSNEARVYARPQLLIDTDDVKCSHGATVGQLEDEELFYLLSRGLSPDTAQSLLTYGFAEDVIEKIAHPQIRQAVDPLILKHLKTAKHLNDLKRKSTHG